MKSIAVIIWSVICCALSISAQPLLPSQVSVQLSGILNDGQRPTIEKLRQVFRKGSVWGQDSNAIAKPWVVYSDRAENPTFMEPNLNSKRFAELNFGEKVCIADIKNDMALVYSDEKVRTNYPNIPSLAKCKGWVPMKNLLLWSECPTDERGFQKIVIVANNLNLLSQGQKFLPRKYQSPDNASRYANLGMDMHFYYVMKETDDGELVLLSTGARVDRGSSPFFGWVNEEAYLELEHRLFIEPNWIPEFVEKHKTERSYIYYDAGKSSIVSWWQFGNENGTSESFSRYRMHSNQMRFHVLSSPDDNGMVRCSCFLDNIRSTDANDFNTDFLKGRLGEDGYWSLIHVHGLYFYDGYAKLNPWWKYVMLYSDSELRELIKELRPVHEAAIIKDSDRSQYVNAIRALLRSHTQGCVNDDEMNGWTPEVLEDKIYGIVNVKSENMRFTKYRLVDIINRLKVSDAEYFDILDRFDIMYRRLEKIPASYNFRMDVDGMYYYWIPIEELP